MARFGLEDKRQRLCFWGRALLGVWTVFVGALFILQVWRVFLVDGAFTAQNVAARFWEIAAFFFLWILLIGAVGVLECLFPQKEQVRAVIDLRLTLSKLKARLSENERGRYAFTVRFAAWCVFFLAAGVCAAMVAGYLLSPAYKQAANAGFFAEHGEAERLVRSLPYLFGAIALAVGVVYFEEEQLKKELAFVKMQIAENAKKGVALRGGALECKKDNAASGKAVLIARCIVGGVALLCIVSGIFNGGMADVLGKAVNICTQCIGLG
jgi:hypothetical protein